MAGTATKRTGTRGRPRSADADRGILEAALRLLAEQGFARMSMDAVAAAAGVSKPTIYLRYRGKAELATAALGAHGDGAAPDQTGDVRADLVAHLRHFRRAIERSSGIALVGNLLAEELHTPALLEAFRERIVGPRRQRLASILEQAAASGQIRANGDLHAAVDMLLGSYYAQYLSGEPFGLRWPEHQVDLALTGLAAQDAGEPGAPPAGGAVWEGMRSGRRSTPNRRSREGRGTG